VCCSAAPSAVASAPDEILLILVLAGTVALHYSVPIALAITALLAIVTVSYQQTIHAYPSGGGSYIVAQDNLGTVAGLVAAAALLVDYVLTVSVSVAAGVAAVTSALPDLAPHRVAIGVACVAAIPLFRPPESRNAAITLGWMAVILGTFFVGLTVLADRLGVVPVPEETVVSQIARRLHGTGLFYYAIQAATALILVLAANTSFADFPRLSSLLARDRFVPRQFANLGERLVFSNGLMVLGGLAGWLLVVFAGEARALIPLCAVGVFISFTLSQSGMVRRWWHRREPGWRHRLAINGVGAVTTGIVTLVIAATKFTHGAWIVVL